MRDTCEDDMKELLNTLKMGYIIAYQNHGSFFGNRIENKQLDKGFFPDEAETVHIEVSGGGRHSIYVRPPVSRLTDITKTHLGKYIKVLKYNADDFDVKRYKVAYFSAALCANRIYDFRGVFAFVCKWVNQNKRLYFCSEGALAAIQKVYPGAMAMRPEDCMPAHFIASKEFTTVWEGYII